MNNLYKHIATITLIALIATGNIFAQTAKKNPTRMKMDFVKNYNNTENLVATLIVKEEAYIPFQDVVVEFYSINDTSRVLLDKIKTNEIGKAIYLINDNTPIFRDSLGFATFEVEFKGNSSSKKSNKQLTVKQLNMDVSFFQKDSIKFIEVFASEINNDKEVIPVKGLNVSFNIKGTFSLLNFGKEKTDKFGKVKINFPVDMPGDTLGELTIIAKVDDDSEYGTVASMGEINWGIPQPRVVEKQRGLGDTDAPLWMVYTLITLLSAVWFHYLYVIYMIVKIKLAKSSI